MLICTIIASISFFIFVFLFLTADETLMKAMLNCCCETELENIKKGQIELNLLKEDIERTKIKDKKKIQQGRKIKKKIEESKKRLESLNKQKIGIIDYIPLAGYRFLQLSKWDNRNEIVKKLNQQCKQFKEQKEAIHYTYYLLSSLFSYMLVGIFAGFFLMAITLSMEFGIKSIVIGGAAFVIFAILGYLPYDNVSVIIKKRKEEIELQFPQVVSKMTLLTVAGMEVTQAWVLTSKSGTGVLYAEMKRVLIELENNVSIQDAYAKFIARCNNNYTTRLGTLMIQDVTKGPAEIVALFTTLNTESWMEHKHNARRKGEQIQSKLLVPTLLMFVGILILIIVPVISGFNF